jgi:hypothetical protein
MTLLVRKPFGISLGIACNVIAQLDATDSSFIFARDSHGLSNQPRLQEIMARLLDGLRDAQADSKYVRDLAVLALPADFTQGQRDACRSAAAGLGLEILAIMTEPEAGTFYRARRQDDGDEPALWSGFGAALRAADHGTHYLFSSFQGEGKLELHIKGLGHTTENVYQARAVVGQGGCPLKDGASVRIRLLATGLCEEAFLDEAGSVNHPIELQADADNPLEWTLCDGAGITLGRIRIVIRQGNQGKSRAKGLTIAGPRARPTPKEVEQVQRRIDELLPKFQGPYRTKAQAKAVRLIEDLLAALQNDEEQESIERLADLNDLVHQLETAQSGALDPPWPHFAQLARRCLHLAANVADHTGRDREELFAHVHAQERYAERAYEQHDQPLYGECRENLEKFSGYLSQLLTSALPQDRPLEQAPEDEARQALEHFRTFLSTVWKRVRDHHRADLEAGLSRLARQAGGLSQRVKTEPRAVLGETGRLTTQVRDVLALLEGRPGTNEVL